MDLPLVRPGLHTLGTGRSRCSLQAPSAEEEYRGPQYARNRTYALWRGSLVFLVRHKQEKARNFREMSEMKSWWSWCVHTRGSCKWQEEAPQWKRRPCPHETFIEHLGKASYCLVSAHWLVPTIYPSSSTPRLLTVATLATNSLLFSHSLSCLWAVSSMWRHVPFQPHLPSSPLAPSTFLSLCRSVHCSD